MIKTLRIGIGYETMKRMTNQREAGKWLRRTLETSGPIYIKIGQFIGNRPDLFGREVSDEVSKLQNQTSVTFKVKKPPGLKKMDEDPVASASIAQVHRGVLQDGRVVAVKIKRPDVDEKLKRELSEIKNTVKLSKIFNTEFSLLNDWFEDFEKTIIDELDFMKEVENIQFFHEMYNKSTEIRVPRVIKEYSGSDKIIMEYINSKPIKTCKHPKIISENLMNSFIEQILYNGVIHGDLHAGNLGVLSDNGSPLDKGTPLDKDTSLDMEQIVMYDFGNVINIPQFYQKAMREVLVACQNRNSSDLLKAMTNMKMKIRDEKAAKNFAEKFFVYLDTLDTSSFAYTQDDIMVPIELDPITMTIIRTHSLVEGICKEIYPQFTYESLIQQNMELLFIEQLSDLMER
jgi:ubiquinone biosynthesis protein